jgi:hypothetical protein
VTLEDTAATDFTTILNDPAATYVVEILDGAAAGEVAEITNITATTFDTPASLGVAAGDSYQLRSAPTLNEVFGTGANATLTGSFDAAGADEVWLPNGSGGFNNYFYSTSFSTFVSSANPFAVPNPPVAAYYPDGLLVQVKANPTSVVITGMVKTTDTIVSVNSGFNVTAINAPVGQTLGNSGLLTVLTPSFDAGAADELWVPNGPGSFTNYFVTNSGALEWRASSSPFFGNEGAQPIGSGILIQRKGAALPDGAKITVPGFYANL